jgi:hypothetical protein
VYKCFLLTLFLPRTLLVTSVYYNNTRKFSCHVLYFLLTFISDKCFIYLLKKLQVYLCTMKHGYGHDTDTDTSIQLNFLENHIIQCNSICRCRTRHVSDTGTRLIRGVSVLHSFCRILVEYFIVCFFSVIHRDHIHLVRITLRGLSIIIRQFFFKNKIIIKQLH